MAEENAENKVGFWANLKDKAMKTTNGMAIGLFGTLIIGTIFDLFAKIPGLSIISSWSTVIKGLMGAGIGLGVALSLNKKGVTVVAAMASGMLGNSMFNWLPAVDAAGNNIQFTITTISDPLSCYISVVLAMLGIKYIMRRKTPVDLLLIPLVGLAIGMVYSLLLSQWVHQVTLFLSQIIEWSFNINGVLSFIMCIIVSTLVGMALTAPISSVAICVAISIGGTRLASIAALIGCCTQMLGFAIHTARDNKWGSVIAVGIGTSMLQFKNIIRKPLVWLPTIIVSAVLGPLALTFNDAWFAQDMSVSALSVSAGMGTSGLVGPLNLWSCTNYCWQSVVWVIGICILAPIILVFLIDLLFRKFGWIKSGDFSLQNDL